MTQLTNTATMADILASLQACSGVNQKRTNTDTGGSYPVAVNDSIYDGVVHLMPPAGYYDGNVWVKEMIPNLIAANIKKDVVIGIGSGGKITGTHVDVATVTYSGYNGGTPTGLARTGPTAFAATRNMYGATKVGNYALFGGGQGSAAVEAYNTSLTKSTLTALTSARYTLAAATVGNYGLFGGGDGYQTTVDAYDTSLTKVTNPTGLSSGRGELAATAVGGYALFGGGYNGSWSNVVDAYNSSLTRTTPTVLNSARKLLAAAPVGNYALFGAGAGSGGLTNLVDAYDTSLTKSTPTAMASARYNLAAAPVGNYALFAGGNDGTYAMQNVEAYDTSLTRSSQTAMTAYRLNLAAASISGYALFAGGFDLSSLAQNTVETYNTSLVKSTAPNMGATKGSFRGTAVGNYAIFGGDMSYTATDAYSLAYPSTFQMPMPVGSVYNFGGGDVTAAQSLITVNNPVTGYVKYISGTI